MRKLFVAVLIGSFVSLGCRTMHGIPDTVRDYSGKGENVAVALSKIPFGLIGEFIAAILESFVDCGSAEGMAEEH